MPSKKNSDIGDGAIVASYSIQRSLKPNLPVIAQRLGLPSLSAMLSMLASDVDAAVDALAPLAAASLEAERRRKEVLASMGKMSAEQLANLFEKVVEIEEREDALKRPPNVKPEGPQRV